MTNHDRLNRSEQKLMENLNQKFSEYTFDLQEVMEMGKDPVFLSLLLYKVAEERKKTNDLLEQINEKYDKIMLELKTNQMPKREEKVMSILPDQDQQIINLTLEKGMVTAEEVREALKYKGKNAASQRLNKLYQEGYLKKVQSGRKVLYLPSE